VTDPYLGLEATGPRFASHRLSTPMAAASLPDDRRNWAPNALFSGRAETGKVMEFVTDLKIRASSGPTCPAKTHDKLNEYDGGVSGGQTRFKNRRVVWGSEA
jgi:hypothetical protein